VMDAIIDRFGEDVTTCACDMENFHTIVEVAVNNVLFSWIVGFYGLVKIKSPADVKERYAYFVKKAFKSLELISNESLKL